MNLKFWKKEPDVVPEKKTYSVLEVHLKNRQYVTLSCQITKGDKTMYWRGFWKWYFMKDSPIYSLEYKQGRYLIERKNIDLVHIFTKTD